MSMIGFPLLLIPLAIYNIFAFLMPGVAFTSPVIAVPLLSRAPWSLTFGDALLVLGIILVVFEIVKAARPGAKYLTDHLLSFLVFAAAAAEFVLLPLFATSAFFLLTVLAGAEFFGSMWVAWRRHSPKPVTVPHDVPEATPQAPDAADSGTTWQRPAPVSQPVTTAKSADAKSHEALSATVAVAAAIATASPTPASAIDAPQPDMPLGKTSGDEKARPLADEPKSQF